MDERAFWKIIDLVDRDGISEDDTGAVEPLIAALSKLARSEIASFEEQLAQRLYALDGRRYAEAAGESGASADAFLYARCFVVARGESHFRSVVAQAAFMPTATDEWCEALVTAAVTALQRATGEFAHFETTVSYETGSNRAAWG